MASFSGKVATPRWSAGVSETPLPSPLGDSQPFEGEGPIGPSPFFMTQILSHLSPLDGLHLSVRVVR